MIRFLRGPTIKPNERTDGISSVPREAMSVWPSEARPYRLTVRTPAFQAVNPGSIPGRVTNMKKQRSILFVCTGNVFRSVAAEGSFKKYLSDNGIEDWKVGSAGIIADPQDIDPKVLETLKELGIDASAHTQRRLTKEMLAEYDAVVAMAENHIEFMKSELNYQRAVLFNALAVNEETSIYDIDTIPDYKHHRPAVEDKLRSTIRYIHEKTPAVYQSVLKHFYS